MPRRFEPDLIPCNQPLVNTGSSYNGPPESWRTFAQTCAVCRATFTVTASEQRFWYEGLRIPMIVRIDRCPACRRRQRGHRRIIARLTELLPAIERGSASITERREAALAIACAVRMTTANGKQPIITRVGTIEQGLAIIADLRKESTVHDDLVLLQILLTDHLGHAKRVAKFRAEHARIAERGKAMTRAVRDLERYLSAPSPSLWRRIVT